MIASLCGAVIGGVHLGDPHKNAITKRAFRASPRVAVIVGKHRYGLL